MTDNVKRLRAMAQGEARSGIGRQRRDVFEAAADEIECLRAENQHNADGWKWAAANVEKLHDEIWRLETDIRMYLARVHELETALAEALR